VSLVVSVVIPTHNRADRLPRLVAALRAQEAPGPFEIVIVDDCSTDETWAVLQTLTGQHSVAVRAMRTPRNSGPATARNIGWRAAQAPLIVFTDDDCLPDAGWLAALVHASQTADAAQGVTIPERDVAFGPFARSLWIEEWSDLFETCNMAYQRELLERLGGFDEAYRRPYGEDVDLGWRAMEVGATSAFVPTALVFHAVEHDTERRDFVAEVRGHSRKVWLARSLKRHPGMRRRLYRRCFHSQLHARMIASLGCTAAMLVCTRGRSRWLWLAVSWLPYLHYRVSVKPRHLERRRDLPRVVALGVVSDAVEVGAIVGGAVRFRSVII
jgi:GT2 family glycosyltransferase